MKYTCTILYQGMNISEKGIILRRMDTPVALAATSQGISFYDFFFYFLHTYPLLKSIVLLYREKKCSLYGHFFFQLVLILVSLFSFGQFVLMLLVSSFSFWDLYFGIHIHILNEKKRKKKKKKKDANKRTQYMNILKVGDNETQYRG